MRPKQHVTWPGTSQRRLVLTLTSGGSSSSDHQSRHWSRVVHEQAFGRARPPLFLEALFSTVERVRIEVSEASGTTETCVTSIASETSETLGTFEIGDLDPSVDCETACLLLLFLFSVDILEFEATRWVGLFLSTSPAVEFRFWWSVDFRVLSIAPDRSMSVSRWQQYRVRKGQGNPCGGGRIFKISI